MTRIDIYSGFLGAGKTTLIKKLIAEGYKNQKVVLIENEFGEIGIDGGFLQDAGIEIREINSGCICCSLTGDFKEALKKVEETYHPDVIIIEPSGVGKLTEVASAVMSAGEGKFEIKGLTTIVDCKKAKMYLRNFGEFFGDQVAAASCIALSRTQMCSDAQVEEVVKLLKLINPVATILTAPWDELSGEQILEAVDGTFSVSAQIQELLKERDEDHEDHDHEHCCHHDHDHEEDEEHECCHHHDHEEGEEHECCHHHDHEEGEEHECCHHDHEEGEEHECCHHHDHDEDEEHECCHGHHHDDHEGHCCHHHSHDADEVFQSWGKETAKKYTEDDIEIMLERLLDIDLYGIVVRAKGIVPCEDGGWIHFDYTPGEVEVRKGSAVPTGLLCVIGSQLNTENIEKLFEA